MRDGVRPCGRLFGKDADGALCNDSSLELLPEGLQPLVDECIGIYRQHLGDRLHSVYLRGSAVRGTFVPGVSDLDTLALTHDALEGEGRVVSEPYAAHRERLDGEWPQVMRVELYHTPIPRIQLPERRFARMLLATQGVIVWGKDIRPSFGRFWPGTDTLGHVTHIADTVAHLLAEPSEDTALACSWICKAIVRAGMEIHAADHGQYSRDLWPCWAMFAAYHPDQADLMFEALTRAVYPTDDAAELHQLLESFQTELVPLVRWTSET